MDSSRVMMERIIFFMCVSFETQVMSRNCAKMYLSTLSSKQRRRVIRQKTVASLIYQRFRPLWSRTILSHQDQTMFAGGILLSMVAGLCMGRLEILPMQPKEML